MAKFRYQHIKSSVEGKAPTSSQLKVGEIGVNDFAGDEKLFIKNSENEVVDFPRGYSRQYVDEQQEAVAASLNDLEERKLDASAYTPTDLSNYYNKDEINEQQETVAASLNDLEERKLDASAYTPTDLSDYYTKEEIDEQQETVAASLNDLEERKANESDLEEIGEATAYALNDIECRKADKDEFDDQFETIAASLNDLEDRKLDKTEMPDLGDLEAVIAASLNDLEERKLDKDDADEQFETIAAALVDLNSQSETVAAALVDLNTRKANVSDIPSVNGYADSVKYNSESHYVEFYHGTTAGTKVFEYDASPFLIDGMVESVVVTSITSGGSEVQVLEITWNSAAGSQVTDIPLSDIFDPDEYYTKDEVDEADRVIAEALNDLNTRKLDASAYTPTDLSNYYTKSETSGATELSTAFSNIHTHSNKSELDSITGNVGTMAYENANSYSSATEVNTALGNKADTATTLAGYGITDAYTKSETSGATELSTAFSTKADTATTLAGYGITDAYTKSETSGATEIQNALDGKLDSSSIDQVIDSTTSASTGAVSTSAVYDFVTAYTPSITVDNVIDNTTSASTNPVSTSAVYRCIKDNELVTSTAVNNLEEDKADREEDLDGIKLKKITQSDYDDLVQAGTVDPNTLYIITD